MSEPNFLKCPCQHCGNNIEFPQDAAGRVVVCPHCSERTLLSVAGANPSPVGPPGGKTRVRSVVNLITLLVILSVAVLLVLRHKQPSQVVENSKLAAATSHPTNDAPTQSLASVEVKRPKSPEDLQAGGISLERTKGSGLVYAMGDLKNDSTYQRYGVRVELTVLDQDGETLGTAQDYKDILEPRQTWKFHALITDPKAASAKVLTIKEQN